MAHLPSLGPRGEGWVVLQGILLATVGAAGLLALAGVNQPTWEGPVRVVTSVVGLAAMAAGAGQARAGVRDLGANLTPLPHPTDESELVQSGIYGKVRHPIYGGLILLGLGWALLSAYLPAIPVALLLVPFFWLKSSVEERWLQERFPSYADYRRRARRFIAWIG
jgi:protein-S-isoprenylcysteine O-methyltransferase Ste14